MANRKNTFLIKRSNVAGKVPAAGDLLLGELALNTADNILYASGTTAGSILPIGWDRVARTGDTVTGNFNFIGDLSINGSSLPSGYALSVTGDTNLIGDVYVRGDLNYSGSVFVTGSTIIEDGLTANTIYTDYIDFNTNYTGATTQGRLSWDGGTGTLNIGVGDVGGTLIDLQVGQEEVVRVYNSEATTLLKGEIVYVFGSQGNRPSVKRAIATSDGYSVTTLGMIASDITSGDEGYATTFGIISNLNTNGLTGGTALWLSPTVAGGYTETKPQAPYHTVLLGYVVRVSPTVGSVFVNISNGWEIDELHDVRINGKTFGDLLSLSAYNGSNVWVNSKTLNGSYTITGDTTVGGQLKANSVSATTINASGDINASGYLRSYNSTGDEGGEVFLNKAATNTTLIGGVTIDVWQNRLRFFEQGGTARGAYIDLTAAGAGVSTNLLSGGGGEINTASNLSGGTGLFAQKVAADLQFKSLTSTGGTVTISNDATTVNLEVVPSSSFTGGTVTGATNFTGGLSANTISATTYDGLPIDVYVSGGTYSAGIAEFTNSTGGTFNVSGFKTNDLYVTGGTYDNGLLTFTNNTGGTFNITTTTNYSSGPISGATGWSNNSGEMNLPAIKVSLANNTNNIEPNLVYDIASGTTGSGGITSLSNNDTNYVVVEYNGGSPRYNVYNNDGVVDDSSVVIIYIVYRVNTFIHVLEFGNYGAGLANKLNDRFMMTDRFGWESGLNISLSASTGVIDLSAGVAWNGPYRQSLVGINSQDDVFFKNFHSGGTWTYTTTGNTLNNTYYDDGTDIVIATSGKYLTNYYYRGQEVNDHMYEVYSTSEYDSITEAEAATNPELPELITSHAFLVGRIIVEVGATTGITQTAFATVFQASGYAPSAGNHNDLSGLQGGTGGEYYHLTSDEYNNNAYTNVDNNFSTTQTINGSLKVTGDVSANTNSISSDNLITVALLYLSNNT